VPLLACQAVGPAPAPPGSACAAPGALLLSPGI